MSRTLRYEHPSPSRISLLAVIPIVGLFICCWIGPSNGVTLADRWLGTIELGVFALLALVAHWHMKVLAGRAAVVDDEGVSAEYHGQRLWMLPWSQYGGYRTLHLSVWEQLTKPDRFGIEILNREGIVVGLLPITRRGRTNEPSGKVAKPLRLRKAIFHTLDTRSLLPQSETKPEKPLPKNLAWALSMVGLILIAATVFVAKQIMLVGDSEEPLSPMLTWWAQVNHPVWLTVPGLLGSVFLGVGSTSLLRYRYPKSFEDPKRLPDPDEGPHHDDHELDLLMEKRSYDLQSGVRYRWVHPEAMKAMVNSELGAIGLVLVLIPLMSALTLFSAFTHSGTDWSFIVFVMMCFSGSESLGLWVMRRYRAKRDVLHDTLVYQDGVLVAVHPDGTHRTFAVDSWKPIKSVQSSGEYLRDAKGRYYIDRARLYPCPTDPALDDVAVTPK